MRKGIIGRYEGDFAVVEFEIEMKIFEKKCFPMIIGSVMCFP